MILVVTSDEIIGKCLIRALKKKGLNGHLSDNAIEAINWVVEAGAPEIIYLDVFLTGPDGFTFLNEMVSYADTIKVPVVLMSEEDFASYDLSAYNVVGFLNKNTMVPAEIVDFAEKYATVPAEIVNFAEKYATVPAEIANFAKMCITGEN